MLYVLFHAASSEIAWGNYVNVALNKSTWQSGQAGMYGSYLAVDGNKNTNYSAGSCSHTAIGVTPPWWAVDLGSLTYVYGVNLTNRYGNGSKYLVRSMVVKVSFVFCKHAR